MNLAKAELIFGPSYDAVLKRVGHGLSVDPDQVSVANNSIGVVDGIFALLYERRTGKKLPKRFARIPMRRLFARCRESLMELAELGIADVEVSGAYHVYSLADGRYSRSELLVENYEIIASSYSTKRRLGTQYMEEGLYGNWRAIFGLPTRYQLDLDRHQLLRSKKTIDIRVSDEQVLGHMGHVRWLDVFDTLSGVLEPAYVGDVDAYLTTSLSGRAMVPMPTALARYACFYYISTLVRYKPSAVHPVTGGRQAWFYDAYIRQAPIFELVDFYNHMANVQLTFIPSVRV